MKFVSLKDLLMNKLCVVLTDILLKFIVRDVNEIKSFIALVTNYIHTQSYKKYL